MKRAIQSTGLVFFMLLMTAALPQAWGAPPLGSDTIGKTVVTAGYLENVAFEKLPGKERVILTVSKLSEFTAENPPGNAVVVRLENLFVPEGLRRSLSDPSLANVVRVTPVQKTGDGRSWVLATIELRQKVPYSVRPEGMNVLIDFNVSSLVSAVTPSPEKPISLRTPAMRQAALPAEVPIAPVKGAEVDTKRGKQVSTNPVTLRFSQEEDIIKVVFPLMTDILNKDRKQGEKVSIVAGNDVKGTMSLNIEDVPWDQAFDAILESRGLYKIQKGNVIQVMSQENFLKSQESFAKSQENILKIKKAEDDLVIRAYNELAMLERLKRQQMDTEPLITRIVPIKYRMLQFIKKIEMKRDVLISGAGKESAPGAGGSKASQLDEKSDLSMDGSGPQKKDVKGVGYRDETATKKVSIEGAGDFIQLLQSLLSTDEYGKQRGWIGADPETNSIIITAIRRDLYSIMDMIAKMDVPTDQILIKANIVEATKTTARNLGIQWGGMLGQKLGNQNIFVTPGGTGGSTVPPGSAIAGGYVPGAVPGTGQMGMGGQGYGVNFPAAVMGSTGPASLGLLFGTIGGNILDIQLSALQKDGKLNILSSPSLMTLDNQMASTESGEDIPFVTPGTATSPPTVTWKRAVLRLEITPHVVDVRNIKLTIVVKKDEADFSRLVLGQPTIIVKETKTDLVVANGETIVISGLTKQKGVTTESGVPWLKEVPVLGWLFKGEGKSEDMEETLIFITPNIIKTQEVAGIQTGP